MPHFASCLCCDYCCCCVCSRCCYRCTSFMTRWETLLSQTIFHKNNAIWRVQTADKGGEKTTHTQRKAFNQIHKSRCNISKYPLKVQDLLVSSSSNLIINNRLYTTYCNSERVYVFFLNKSNLTWYIIILVIFLYN